MISFLSQVAKEIVDSGRPLESLKIILPSQRAVRLLKIELAKQLDRPALSPESNPLQTLPQNCRAYNNCLRINCYSSVTKVIAMWCLKRIETPLNCI